MFSKFCFTGLIFLCISHLVLSLGELNSTLDHDHDHDHGMPPKDWFLDHIFKEFASQNDTISLKEIQIIIDTLKNNSKAETSGHEGHDDHADHDHRRRSLDDDHDDDHGDDEFHKCYSAIDLFEIFEFDANQSITKSNFSLLSPSLVWLAIENACADQLVETNSTTCTENINQKYLFGSITILAIWISSITSVLIISRIKVQRNLVILALNSLAVGTLLADALLHIIPKAIGLHSHGGEEEGSIHAEVEKSPNDMAWKMFVVLSTLFLLMIFDFFGGHGHSHDSGANEHGHSHGNGHVHSNTVSPDEVHDDHEIRLYKINGKVVAKEENDEKIGGYDLRGKSPISEHKKFFELFKGTGLLIFLANLIHKAADGLVIGAAFGASLSLGFSTALAVLFHEIPHELGDYGLLSTTGFKTWQIVVLNGLGSFAGLCSLLIITSVNSNPSVREWIFAVTAGLFIYISLAGMIPRLKVAFEKETGKMKQITMLLMIVGFWIGTVFMLLLSLYEDDIRIDVKSLSGC